MSHECFSVLHPWAYELDLVDFKYVLNNNLRSKILSLLEGSESAQIFWLTFFKTKLACAADEFFEAIRQLCEINHLQGYWEKVSENYEDIMVQNYYVIGIDHDSKRIIQVVEDFCKEAIEKKGYCVLSTQIKMYPANFLGTCYAD
jgi:hypothetical protein